IDQFLISQYESAIDSQPFCHGTDDDRPKLCIEWQGTVDTPPSFTYHSQSMRIIYYESDFSIGSDSVKCRAIVALGHSSIECIAHNHKAALLAFFNLYQGIAYPITEPSGAFRFARKPECRMGVGSVYHLAEGG